MCNEVCLSCDKWKKEKERVLSSSESIFEAASEMQKFEDECVKTCPRIISNKI